MIKTLIFDFDGLIIDTEMPDFESWQSVYQRYGQSLPIEMWGQVVGGSGASDFDPHSYLEQLVEQSLDREQVWLSRRFIYLRNIASQPILPGVVERITEAEEMDIRVGLASSSPENWVHGHLKRIGLLERFQVIKTADDVTNTKPDPELFLAVLAEMDLAGKEAIVFEDSPNGILAAHLAGTHAVAIPNAITAQLPFKHASLQLNSLADLTLSELIQKLEN